MYIEDKETILRNNQISHLIYCKSKLINLYKYYRRNFRNGLGCRPWKVFDDKKKDSYPIEKGHTNVQISKNGII